MFTNKPSILLISILNVYIFGIIQANDDCPECGITFSCDSFGCESNQVCIMEKVECVSDPCPEIPKCIKSSSVCKGNKPLLDQTGGAVTCESGCRSPYECVKGFCCPTTVMPPLTNTVNTNMDKEVIIPDEGGIPPNLLEEKTKTNMDKEVIIPVNGGIPPNLLEEKISKPSEDPCSPCQISLCFTAKCKEPENILCVQDNCSCAIWFADQYGNQVECLDTGVHENPFPVLPNIDGMVVTLEPTEKKKTLASYSDPEANGLWKYPVIGICAIALVCVGAFIVYKAVMRRREQKQQNSKIQDEQKVPLQQDVSPAENNNDSKLSKTITADPPEMV